MILFRQKQQEAVRSYRAGGKAIQEERRQEQSGRRALLQSI
jgi:hypothetical protein